MLRYVRSRPVTNPRSVNVTRSAGCCGGRGAAGGVWRWGGCRWHGRASARQKRPREPTRSLRKTRDSACQQTKGEVLLLLNAVEKGRPIPAAGEHGQLIAACCAQKLVSSHCHVHLRRAWRANGPSAAMPSDKLTSATSLLVAPLVAQAASSVRSPRAT